MKSAPATRVGEAGSGIPGEVVLRASGLQRFLGAEPDRGHVLRGVALSLRSGESCAVVGPSGCGKSSLLYALGLIDRPDAGEIWVNGRELARADELHRTRARLAEIGFVFQFHNLLGEFTVCENVMLPMEKLGRLSRLDMRQGALHLLERVGLADKADRLASALSGGEQQRVAVARSLANHPRLLLADEPTGNLDAASSERIADLLLEIAQDEGQAVMIVTHNQKLAGRCNRVLAMSDGRIL